MKKRTSLTLSPELLKWAVPYLRKTKTSLSGLLNETVLKLSSSVAEQEKQEESTEKKE